MCEVTKSFWIFLIAGEGHCGVCEVLEVVREVLQTIRAVF